MEKVHPASATDNVAETKEPLNKKKLIFNVLKIVISGGLIYWILRDTNLAEIFTAVRDANLWLLLLALSLHLLGFTISAYRWRILLRTRGSDASILFLIESYIVGMFFNNFLPSTIGGDSYRAYDAHRLGQSKSSAVAVVFVDRFLGLVAMMLFALLALFGANELIDSIPLLSLWVSLGLLGMLVFLWLIFMPPKWLPTFVANLKLPFGNKIKGIIEAFLAFQGQGAALVKALFLSILLQANVVIYYYIIAEAMGLPIPFFSFFLIVPLVTIITMLPISVNGIGVRENTYVFLFAAFAVLQPEAVAFAWIDLGMRALQGVLGGIVYALRR
ncbi:MAG: flippase-like domain-containing protein [Chloroflexi bacterium]|nr:flippase-like domain-containing protein [Chloroflexota bacterium]